MATARQVGMSAWAAPGAARVKLSLTYVGAELGVQTISAPELESANSVCRVDTTDLASGFNTITVPVVATATKATGVWIIPPAGNTQTMTLKGVTGDTGISMHLTGWQYLSLAAAGVTSFGITAGAAIPGVRFLWV